MKIKHYMISSRSKLSSRQLKKVAGYLHLWLGLFSGAVILVSMLGAAIFVWEKELTQWYYADIVLNEYNGEQHEYLPISELYQSVREAYPDKDFTFTMLNREPRENFAFLSYQVSTKPGWTWFSEADHYLYAYVNPYTGVVTGHIDMLSDWITIARHLHQNLLLRYDIGSHIIGAAGLIMIFMAISGLVLWWPKTMRSFKKRTRIKWSGSFKRVNWDLHSSGGFYTWILLLFFATTGLVWSYQWWENGIYRLLGTNPDTVFEQEAPPTFANHTGFYALDHALADAIKRQPVWTTIYMVIPAVEAKEGVISIGLNYNKAGSGWDNYDYYYYHPVTGELHGTFTFDEQQLGEKWRYSNYKMHVGSIYGLPTKVIAFLSALFFAFLPISGFLIWWGRGKKSKQKSGVGNVDVTEHKSAHNAKDPVRPNKKINGKRIHLRKKRHLQKPVLFVKPGS